MLPYVDKGVCSCDYIKGLGAEHLSWIIWVDAICSHMHPYKKEAGRFCDAHRRGGRGRTGLITNKGTYSHQKVEGARHSLFHGAPRDSATCQHLDFSPGILISELWPPALWEIHFYHFKILSLRYSVTTAMEAHTQRFFPPNPAAGISMVVAPLTPSLSPSPCPFH